MNFSEKLFELRKKEGLSQEELAEKIDVSRQTISKWESGQSIPEMDKLIVLSNIFNISIDELVGKESVNTIENKNESNINTKVNKKHKVLKIIVLILIIYLVICIFKFIVFTRQELIIDSFNESNYSLVKSIVTRSDRLLDNPSYLNVFIEKVGNKYIETQYNTKDYKENPARIHYVELDKNLFYEMMYDEESNKYVVLDGLSGYTAEEKENYFNDIKDSQIVKDLSNINRDIKTRLLNSINPFVFVNPFSKTILIVVPFNATFKYEYNNDYLVSRILINNLDINSSTEWIISYDYVPEHFDNREITNPIESGKYEIVYYKDLIQN